MSLLCKICGKEVPIKRVEILRKFNKTITCIDCSTEDKVVGNQVTTAKDTREIEIISKKQADKIFKTSKAKPS